MGFSKKKNDLKRPLPYLTAKHEPNKDSTNGHAKWMGETQEALTLYKELQAIEDSWQQERGGLLHRRACQLVSSAKQSPKTYIQVTFYDQTVKKRGHKFE